MSSNPQKQVNDLHETIREMAEASIAVKGQQFADVALGAFECMQIIEMMAIIAEDYDDLDEQELGTLMEQTSLTLGSLMTKMARGMSEGDRADAAKLGDQMMSRKIELQERLSGS